MGTKSFFDKIFKAIQKQDALEFVGEAYIIHQVCLLFFLFMLLSFLICLTILCRL